MLTSSMLFLHIYLCEILHMAHTLASKKIGLCMELQTTSKLRFSHAICRKVELLNIYLQEIHQLPDLEMQTLLPHTEAKFNQTPKRLPETAPTAMKLLRLASGWEKCLQACRAKYVALFCSLPYIHVNCNTGFCVMCKRSVTISTVC